MEKTNIQIVQTEDKVAKSGLKYSRFKTNAGWMSAFDETLIEDLKKFLNKVITVDVETNEQGWKTIRGIIDSNYQPESHPSQLKVEEVKVTGDNNIDVKKVWNNNKNTTMYTSYAKDLIIAGKTSADAIAIVKEIKEAFE